MKMTYDVQEWLRFAAIESPRGSCVMIPRNETQRTPTLCGRIVDDGESNNTAIVVSDSGKFVWKGTRAEFLSLWVQD